MNIIISPAKKMRVDRDFMEPAGVPVYMEDTRSLLEILKAYSFAELKTLFAANDDITRLNYERYQEMDLDSRLTPAVLSYVGLQYQSMAAGVFTSSQWDYVGKHLKILSGFYGILGACDGIVPYRLEMQAKLSVNGAGDLYGFWGDKLYRELVRTDRVIINLASKEYSRAVEPYLEPDVTFITCAFGEESGGRVKVKAAAAKMARGEMVRFMAERGVSDTAELKEFTGSGYRYREDLSSRHQWIFVKS